MAHNRLSNIDENILSGKLGLGLKELDLTNNSITVLKPTAFQHLIELTTLSLSNNPGIKLTKDLFPKALGKLKTLELNWCEIHDHYELEAK